MEETIKNFNQIFDDYNKVISEHFQNFNEIFDDYKLKPILKEYREESVQFELGFNVFQMVVKRLNENFHSEILKSLLELGEGKILKSFIEFLNTIRKTKEKEKNLKEFEEFQEKYCSKIEWGDFYGSVIKNEEGRIDISIANESTKSVIIIENKIKNAKDQANQLPRYYKYYEDKFQLKEDDYKKRKIYIIYLPLDINKKIPDDEHREDNKEGDWKNYKNKVYNNFITLPAYTKKGNDLYSWVKSCIADIEEVNILATFKQYADLIKFLGGKIMDNRITKKFYENIKDKNYNYEDLKSFRYMLNNLHIYRADSIENHFREEGKKSPFTNVQRHKEHPACVVLDGFTFETDGREFNLQIDIWGNGYEQDHCSYSVDIYLKETEETKEKLAFLEEKYKFQWDDGDRWSYPNGFYSRLIPYFDDENNLKEREQKLFDFMEKLLPEIEKEFKK